MKDIKYRAEYLCIYDYCGVEKHLAAMAAKGWRLERAGNRIWKYRRAEPARVRYAVTYNSESSQFNPEPTEGQQSQAELCAAAGWEKVSDWFQMQIFCTEDENAVPLETDETVRLEAIHRSMRKNFLPGNILMLVIGLLYTFSFFYGLLSGDVYRLLSDNSRLLSSVLLMLLVILEAYILCHYYLWRRRSQRSVLEGGVCEPINTRAYQMFNRCGLIFMAVLTTVFLLAELFSRRKGTALLYVVFFLLFCLTVFLVRQTTGLLRKLKASKSVNIVITLIVDFALYFVIISVLVYGSLHFGWFFDIGSSGGTYEYRGQEWDSVPRQDFPLTLAELTGERYDHVSRRIYDQGSIFLTERDYSETALFHDGPEVCGLDYTVYETAFPWFQEVMLRDFLEDGVLKFRGMTMTTRRYLPDDPTPWNAESVYRRYYDERPANFWLLVWPGRIVGIGADDTLTEAQKSLIAARLGPQT